MKANELMIGDWVYDTILEGNTKVEFICKEGIRGDFHEGVWREETFEPVPVTSEVLEKNGFVEHRDGFYATEQEQLAGDGFVVRNMVYYKSRILSVVTERGEIGLSVKFIHELQHALRLCGIDKEIVL